MKLSRNAVIVLGLVLVVSCLYFIYAYFTLPPTRESHGFFGEAGEAVGVLVLWGMVLLYSRGVVKLVINQGPLLGRFLPAEFESLPASLGQGLLQVLNRTHPALGILTILLGAAHAGMSSSGRINLFLLLTMGVMFWQGGFGLFLKSRMTPAALRRHSYGVHSQLMTGGLILIFASFGHLLVGD